MPPRVAINAIIAEYSAASRSPSSAQRTRLRCRLPSPMWPNSTGMASGACSATSVGGFARERRDRRQRQRHIEFQRRPVDAEDLADRLADLPEPLLRADVHTDRGLAGQLARSRARRPAARSGRCRPPVRSAAARRRRPGRRRRGARRSASLARASISSSAAMPSASRNSRPDVDERRRGRRTRQTAVTRCAGVGCSRRSRPVMTPSVPSAPTNSDARS